jgi:hypothetical protein
MRALSGRGALTGDPSRRGAVMMIAPHQPLLGGVLADSTLWALRFCRLSSVTRLRRRSRNDPIEKKPLNHFRPFAPVDLPTKLTFAGASHLKCPRTDETASALEVELLEIEKRKIEIALCGEVRAKAPSRFQTSHRGGLLMPPLLDSE